MLALLLALSAQAQDPVDVGVVRDKDTYVVQDLLYPKAGRTELGAGLGWMAWDPYTTAPNLQVWGQRHLSESLSLTAVVGGGYGLKTGHYRALERDHGVAVNAYRYLASALVGVEYAPVYGKLALAGRKLFHYDVYGAAKAGVTLESSVLPQGGLALGPTLSLGVGSRLFLHDGLTLRVELRDDLQLQRRKLTSSTHLKQNVNVLVGVTFLGLLEGE